MFPASHDVGDVPWTPGLAHASPPRRAEAACFVPLMIIDEVAQVPAIVVAGQDKDGYMIDIEAKEALERIELFENFMTVVDTTLQEERVGTLSWTFAKLKRNPDFLFQRAVHAVGGRCLLACSGEL